MYDENTNAITMASTFSASTRTDIIGIAEDEATFTDLPAQDGLITLSWGTGIDEIHFLEHQPVSIAHEATTNSLITQLAAPTIVECPNATITMEDTLAFKVNIGADFAASEKELYDFDAVLDDTAAPIYVKSTIADKTIFTLTEEKYFDGTALDFSYTLVGTSPFKFEIQKNLIPGTKIGTHDLQIKIDDQTSFVTYTWEIEFYNDPTTWTTPATPITDQTFTPPTAISIDLSTFITNPEGDALTYTFDASKPAWLTLTGSTLSGTAPAAATYPNIKVMVDETTNYGNPQIDTTFNLIVNRAAPYKIAEITDIAAGTYSTGETFTLKYPFTTYYGEPDGDTISCLPEPGSEAWKAVTYNSGSGDIEITITNAPETVAGANTMGVRCDDNSEGAGEIEQFSITLDSNAAPVFIANPANQKEGVEVALSLVIDMTTVYSDATVPTQTHSVVVTGLPVSGTLTAAFVEPNLTISGTPAVGDTGTHTITLTYKDSADNTGTPAATFSLELFKPPPTEVAGFALATQIAGHPISITQAQTGICTATNSDPVTFTYSFQAISGWAPTTTTVSTDMVVSGTQPTAGAQTYTLDVKCSDVDGDTSFTRTMTMDANPSPSIAAAASNINYVSLTGLNTVIDHATHFTNLPASDIETITFDLDGQGAWVSAAYDAGTNKSTFTVPGAGMPVRGSYTFKVNLADPFANIDLPITVTVTSQPPVLTANAAPADTVIASHTKTVTILGTDHITDPDDSLTYKIVWDSNSLEIDTADGVGVVAWYDNSSSPTILLHTQPALGDGNQVFKLVGEDPDTQSQEVQFTITVTPNTPPNIDNPIADLNAPFTAWVFDMSVFNVFSDAEDTITYTSRMCDDTALIWSFNAGTQTISGTLPLATPTAQCIKFCADDGRNTEVCDDFNVTLYNDDPPVYNPEVPYTFVSVVNTFNIDLDDHVTEPNAQAMTLEVFDKDTMITSTFITLDVNNVMTVVRGYEDQGVHEFVIKAEDGTFTVFFTFALFFTNDCFTTCDTCWGEGTNECFTCDDGYYLQEQSCVPECDLYHWLDAPNQTCQLCNIACDKCLDGGDNTDCIECADTYLQQDLGNSEQSCVLFCEIEHYEDREIQVCVPCHETCAVCEGPDNDDCIQCKNPPGVTKEDFLALYENGECKPLDCGEGHYIEDEFGNFYCNECHPDCKNCFGPFPYNCIECFEDKQLIDVECVPCNLIVGFQYKEGTLILPCVEICGDARDFYFLGCEDGNNDNNDGCSQDCVQDEGFLCQGGNPYQPDICVDIQGPICEITWMSDTHSQIKILCNEKFAFFSDEAEEIEALLKVEIEGPRKDYSVNFQLVDDGQGNDGERFYFLLNIQIQSQLLGEQKEKLILTFLEKMMIFDSVGNLLANSETTYPISVPYEGIDNSALTEAQVAGYASLISSVTGMTVNFILGGMVQATWILMNNLQLISLIPLMNLYFPPNMREFCRIIVPLNGEPTFLPNLFEDYLFETEVVDERMLQEEEKDSLRLEAFNYNYEVMGYRTTYFIINAGRKILLLSGVLFVGPIVIMVALQMKKCKKQALVKIGTKLDNKIRWQFFLRAAIQSYLSFFMSALLNIYMMRWTNSNEAFANLIAIIGMILLCLFPTVVFLIIYYNFNKLETDWFRGKYLNLIQDLGLKSPLQYQFFLVFFMRRIIFCCIVLFFSFNAVIQFTVMVMHEIIFIWYILNVKPYNPGLSKNLTLINELFLLIILIIPCVFLDPSFMTNKAAIQFGKVWIAFVCILIAVSWIAVFQALCKGAKKKLEDRKKKKQLQAEQENQGVKDQNFVMLNEEKHFRTHFSNFGIEKAYGIQEESKHEQSQIKKNHRSNNSMATLINHEGSHHLGAANLGAPSLVPPPSPMPGMSHHSFHDSHDDSPGRDKPILASQKRPVTHFKPKQHSSDPMSRLGSIQAPDQQSQPENIKDYSQFPSPEIPLPTASPQKGSRLFPKNRGATSQFSRLHQ